jgi:alkylation response protein AidB-like acyl-CoA dehydrogenase
MNVQQLSPLLDTPGIDLGRALEGIASHAGELDRNPRFPRESFDLLRGAGILQRAGARQRCELGWEIAVVRSVAAADASSARILDGHFNGAERLALCAPEELRSRELDGVARGELLIGVWGADPGPGEGPPARIEQSARGGLMLRGVKTFCSGAGGVQRALVVARDERGARRLAYVDVTHGTWVDRSWYVASGLRSSESHRVEFRDAPVLALLGGEDELLREPWLARDSVRSAGTWAGLADCILRETVSTLGETAEEVRLHAVGSMRVAQGTIDRWLEHSARSLEDPQDGEAARTLAGECRVALAGAARLIAAEAARVCGSRALVGGGTLDRARRDLDLFLLQHRLDPKLVEIGTRTLAADSL